MKIARILVKCEAGAAAVEYALLATCLAVALVISMADVGETTAENLHEVDSQLVDVHLSRSGEGDSPSGAGPGVGRSSSLPSAGGTGSTSIGGGGGSDSSGDAGSGGDSASAPGSSGSSSGGGSSSPAGDHARPPADDWFDTRPPKKIRPGPAAMGEASRGSDAEEALPFN